MKTTALATVAMLALSGGAAASTSDKVESWFGNMNYSNVTSGGVYETQGARYYTAGGVSARAPITQAPQLVTVQSPRFSAGCAGIDWYSGGFSTINADEFVQHLRAIGQNAQALAFMLAIQVVSPQLAGVMERIQHWSNDYLKMGQDSCQTAMALVGGAMEQMGVREGNCIVKRMQNNGETWDKAKAMCTTGGGLAATEGAGDANQVSFVRGNLTWYVLMEDNFFRTDTEFSELIMNLVGTVIVADDGTGADSAMTFQYVPPAVIRGADGERFTNIYNALLHGRDAPDELMLRRCQGGATADKEGCLVLTDLTAAAPDWDGMYSRVQQIMGSIYNKVRSDASLSQEEIGFIQQARIPIYRFISTTAAVYPDGMGQEHIDQHARLLAEDIVLGALVSVLERVQHLAGSQPGGISETERFVAYRDTLADTLSELGRARRDNKQRAEDYYQMRERIIAYERQIMSRLGQGYVRASLWGR